MACQYSGFRSWARTPCPALKPGESYHNRENKFRATGHGNVYKNGAPTAYHQPASMTALNTAVVGVGDYRVPDVRGVMAQAADRDAARKPKPFLATSTYQSHYPNYVSELLNIRSHSTEEYLAAFHRLDRDRNGWVDVGETRALLTSVYGEEPTAREVGKFMAFFDRNRDGRVTLEEFTAALGEIRDQLEEETAPPERLREPGWVRHQKHPVKLLRREAAQSSMQRDIGVAGDDPGARDVRVKAGMRGTTHALNSGTTKDSFHPPGYSGHIPESRHLPSLAAQADAQKPREKVSEVAMHFKWNMPGYSGHAPQAARNDRGASRTGVTSMTTSGAANMTVELSRKLLAERAAGRG